jgi:tetratricopeptide (TPR) repeat protein
LQVLTRIGRWLRRPKVLVALALIAILGVAAPHLWAWYHLAAGRSELERFHAEEALRHLEDCLRVWPGHFEARLLACRASRRLEDFERADAQLRELQRRHPDASDAVALEWALLHAAGGDFDSVEVSLHNRAEKSAEEAPLIWEALTAGYLRYYRTLDAVACVDRWLQIQPDCVGALVLRGDAWYTGRSPAKASPDYARALELDPQQHRARWRLALCLLDTGHFSEALGHLQEVRKQRANDPEVLGRIARCEHVLGRTESARDLLSSALSAHPDNVTLLRTRGQLELLSGNEVEAERWLRRALELQPDDYHTAFILANALSRQGKAEEAKAWQLRADRLKARLEHFNELTTHRIAEHPLDPALYCEVGVMLIEMGQKEAGRRWLDSALERDPNYGPAHAVLANLAEAAGDREQATYHRRAARGAEPLQWRSEKSAPSGAGVEGGQPPG